MRTIEEVIDSLDGYTAYDIYKFFILNDVKGWRRSRGRCPIANFMSAETGVKVLVGATMITVDDDDDERSYDMGTSMCGFVEAFDVGEFPDLYA